MNTLASDSPLVVNTDLDTIADDGVTSLREAILYANSHDNLLNAGGVRDVITFCIPGEGPHTIVPLTQLPTITEPVVIDGYSQAGASRNSLAVGDNAELKIQLDGQFAIGTGLTVTAGQSKIQGLAIYGFYNGIQLGIPNQPNPVGGNVVEGCFIGTDATGAVRRGNLDRGIWGVNTSDIRIGTDGDGVNDAGERNIILGNGSFGIFIESLGSVLSSSNVIAGNYIGTDRSGLITDPNGIQGDSDDLGNGMGIKLFTMTSTIANNVISGSLYYGVHIQGTDHQGATLAEHNAVVGNFIGTDVTGTQSLPNRVAGVAVEGAEFTTIGGTTVAARNVISGNIGIGGIHLNEAFSTVVQGNYIGVDINGAPLGNTGSPFFLAGDGIEIQAGANNLIGGLTPGAGNVIANNEGAGVMVTANNFVPTSSGNTIRGNTIVNNGGLGIDISYLAVGAAGVTGNDADDTDVGPNGFQNFPLLASVSSTLAGTAITGTLNSTPLTTFTVDFYTNATGDPSGYGEGQTFLGSATVSTDVNGNAAYTVTLTTVAPVGQKVSATATDSLGSTSEFSGTTTVVPGFVAATISGQKFNDLDGNGLKSPGEPGIPGWTFFLDSNSNDVFDSGEPTQLTNIDGDFTFGGLVAGTYRVREIPQQGWTQTSANPGEIVVASSGAIFGGLQFGNFQLGKISGQKFHDTDRDGVRDSAELPLSNIILYLDTDNDGGRDGDEIFTRTLADGSYSFNNLLAGMYHVREETPAGWVTTTPAIDLIVGSGDTYTNGLIGNFRLGSINGIKFNDLNGDGVASSGELGIPDWTIFLDGNGNNILDPGEARTQTDDFGAYSFNLLEAGTYVVREVQQPGWIQTSINPAPILIVPNLSMQMSQADFGNFRLGSIEGGMKFHDVNRNGVKDSDELGLGGWTIFLDTDNDGSLDPGEATRVTDAAGNFSFGNLPAGVYHIREVQQPGWVQTTAPLDVTLSTSGQSLSVGAIGNFRLATINGVKFNDVNGDGIRQVGEAGLENWTIFLDANGNNTRDVGEISTVTNASGGYSFENLGPGTYIVREMQQAGWTQTSLNPPPIIVSPNLSAQSFTANFGNLRGVMPSVIYGTKFLDVTGNGLTSDDTGMAGVQIKLYRDTDNNGTLGSTDGPAVASMLSAVNGTYSFGGLAPGRYFVQEGITPGFVRTGPTLATFYTVIVVAGSTNGPYNFANAEVCDKTYVDQCSVVYIINGCETVTDLRGHVDEGDVVEVRFRVVKAGETFSLVSYTAPASTFSASTAWQQVIFDSDTIAADTAKTYSLKVVVPNSYFQIDFVCGSPIDHFGPAGSNIFYSAQGRLFSADNDGTKTYTPSGLSGYVYLDANNNGQKETSEGGISGVTLTLSGVDIHGAAVTAVATTNSSGYYEFANLPASGPNGYKIVETHPADYLDGIDAIGSQGGESGNDFLSTSRLNSNTNGVNNNFGERQFASAGLSGFVWLDANNDGDIDLSESAIDGAIVELFGTNDLGQVVQMSTTTDADGFYSFNNLRPGQYQLHELQPGGYLDGADSLGSLGGTLSNDLITQIALAAGAEGVNYNFGERPAGTFLHHGQTATIGYWQNKNGQAMLKSLNGGSTSRQLGNWLAVNFPNLYGSTAGSNNLAGKTNAYVAAYYISLFRQQGQKLEAQVLAVALAVYATDSDLAGLTARSYGFEVTRSGTGAALFNVGTSGQAFGVANNSVLSVIQILFATNAASRNGVVYGSQYLRNLANVVYDGINQTGDI